MVIQRLTVKCGNRRSGLPKAPVLRLNLWVECHRMHDAAGHEGGQAGR